MEPMPSDFDLAAAEKRLRDLVETEVKENWPRNRYDDARHAINDLFKRELSVQGPGAN